MSPRVVTTGRIAASVAAVLLVTLLSSHILRVNPTTVALTYLVVILLIASAWGFVEATVASVMAVLSLNFFFLPPVGTFTIADPQNWIALVAFLLTALVTSQLSAWARRRTAEAVARQRDLERLYALSRALLLSERGAAPGAIASHIVAAFDVETAGIYSRRTDTLAWAGSNVPTTMDAVLKDVARRAVTLRDASGLTFVAIHLGGAPIGSVALAARGLDDTVLNSIANLVGIGFERARADAATAHADAARESSELRATVLDALAHEFKTPLTSLRAASSDLLAHSRPTERDHELAEIIDEDVERLDALVTDAVQMLRVDAGTFVVHLEHLPVRPIVAATLKRFARRIEEHRVIGDVPEALWVDADRELLGLALRQLLDNAFKYSPPTSSIEVLARERGTVEIAVRNTGSHIPERDLPRLFERFYRGTQAGRIPGSGLGLAIVQQIARAHGGIASVSSTPEAGTTFTLSLPRVVHA